jgi:hypothetical protein
MEDINLINNSKRIHKSQIIYLLFLIFYPLTCAYPEIYPLIFYEISPLFQWFSPFLQSPLSSGDV